jgi:hypothetical protein
LDFQSTLVIVNDNASKSIERFTEVFLDLHFPRDWDQTEN